MSANAPVNENTSSWLNVALLDRAGAPAAPSVVSYRIDCLTSGASIVPKTDLSAPGATFDIHITSTQNAIQLPANQQEYRRVTVSATYGAGDDITAEFDYVVVNLRFIPLS